MNLQLIIHTLGAYLVFYGCCFLPSILWGIYAQEWAMINVFGWITLSTISVGTLCKKYTKKYQGSNQFTKREGLFLVSVIWIASGIIGALPFYVSGYIPTFLSSLFESVSGFTTTGASVLSDIEALPQSLLFWRSLTHWLGGLGIVVLFILVLPHLGVGGRALFHSEVPGPHTEVLKPKIRETAFILLKIYIGLTVIETFALCCCGMTIFDSICHTFGTLATGGYSTKNTSVAAFDSISIEIVLIVFMFLAGVNFSLYHYFLSGQRNIFWKDTEFRAYFLIIISATTLIMVDLSLHFSHDILKNLREVLFQVVSVQTTTGYGTADYDKWPGFSKLILFALMFIGGCAGSTSGSFKVIRWVIVFKYIFNQIEHVFRPQAIRPIRLGKVVIEDQVVNNIIGLFCLWIIIFGVTSIIISSMGFDMMTSMSATAATLNSIGPGFVEVGPTMNFSVIPDLGKLLLVICMLFGRLEIYTFVILFHPAFWKK
ncbi:TrkH family potassium uptake protein [Candidatus Uabimicrobium sp. HlEnr_7]|uniref:TrkH family potassium uptake protein n=1 Tax=Candidatus Uabimicrobium helgolandensis TaxID=3095367 RepID=UPI003557EDCE